MFKKIILILAILAVLTAGALFYVNKVLLPVQIKGMLVKAAEESLNRKVSLDSLQYTLLNGFVLDNLTIYSRENPEEVFVHIDRASTQVFFPGLVQKKIILPSVRLVNLSARVIRFNADTWNFSDLIAPKPGTATDSAQAAPPDIVIGGFSVSNARIKLTDLVGGDSFSEMFEPVNLTGSLALPASLRVTGDIHIPSTRGSAVFAVRMGIKNRNLKADIELNNILAGKYLRFIPEGINVPVKALTITRLKTTVSADNNAVTVTGALLLNNINAEPLPGMKARGSLGLNNLFFTADKNSVNLKAAIDLKDAALETPDGRKFKASCKTTETRFTLKNTDWTLSTDATLTGASALLGEGQNIEGDITLSKLSVRQAKDQGLHAQGDLVLNHFSARLPGVLVNAALLASGSTLEFRDDTIDIKARPIFNSLDISLPGATPENRGMSFKGAPAASVHAVIPVKGQTPSYDATVELKNGLFTGAPVVGAISAIRASLQIRTDEALIRNMSFSVFDTPVTASGEVHGFASPRLDLNAKAKDVDLALVQKIIPQIIQDNELLVTGRMDISAEIKGQAVELATKGIKAVATLKDTAVDSGKLKQSLRNISGILTYNAPDLSWKDLSIGFQGKTYLLNGRIQNLANPLITTSLKTENITADARVKKTGDGFTIDSLSAAWFDSSLSASGTVRLLPEAAPVIDITATGSAFLRDIPKMAPQYAKQVEALKLAGALKINARVKGNSGDWQHLNSTARVEIPTLSVSGYTLENISFDASQRDGALQPLEIKGRLYGGYFGIIGSVDLVKPNFPFESTFKLDRTNLEQLKRDTPLKTRQLSGFLSVNGIMKGNATGIKSLSGKTTAQITEGYLWDFEILSKVLSILSSSFQGGNVIITDASGTFTLNEGKVETNDLTLKSASASLLGEGSLDMLSQEIDLNITPRLQPQSPSGTGADLLSALNPAEGLLNIHISGTLSRPKFEHNLSTPNMIKKTLQNTVGGLLKIFE